MSAQKEYKGYNGNLILSDTGVIIKRGFKGFLFGGMKLRGDKTIPYSSIVAVQLKKAWFTAGYIQLTLKGGSEAKWWLFQSTMDENSINFYQGKNEIFKDAKEIIEKNISGTMSNKNSDLDELEKLAKLRDKWVLSQEEFDAKKKKILDL